MRVHRGLQGPKLGVSISTGPEKFVEWAAGTGGGGGRVRYEQAGRKLRGRGVRTREVCVGRGMSEIRIKPRENS